jgi:phospholipase/carboxylesterase
MPLQTFEIEPSEPQGGSVIWLHGLGGSHHDFEPVVAELRAPFLRFVFPSAPLRHVTINYGMRMPAWYDMLSLAGSAPQQNLDHLRESATEIGALIEREHARGVPQENIVLAGFSQGGAMVLHVGLRSRQRLAGILVLSGYVPSADTLALEAQSARRDTPILFCHGRHDRVVPYLGGRQSHALVQLAGFHAQWAEFDVAHTMNLDEVHFIRDWLRARFPQR